MENICLNNNFMNFTHHSYCAFISNYMDDKGIEKNIDTYTHLIGEIFKHVADTIGCSEEFLKGNEFNVYNYNNHQYYETHNIFKNISFAIKYELERFVYEEIDRITMSTTSISRSEFVKNKVIEICENLDLQKPQLSISYFDSVSERYLFVSFFQSLINRIEKALLLLCDHFDPMPFIDEKSSLVMVKTYIGTRIHNNKKYTRYKKQRFIPSVKEFFPFFKESDLDFLYDKFLESYGKHEDVFFHISDHEDGFSYAYSAKIADSSNVKTTSFVKHLANSCIQYPISDSYRWSHKVYELGFHPSRCFAVSDEVAEEYGSRMKILYVTNKPDPYDNNARIFGRVNYSESVGKEMLRHSFGPMYVVSQIILDKMVNYITNDIIVDSDDNEKFISNLKVKKESCETEGFWKNTPIRIINPDTGKGISIRYVTNRHFIEENFYDEFEVVFPYIDNRKCSLSIREICGNLYGVLGRQNNSSITGLHGVRDTLSRTGYTGLNTITLSK